VFTETEEVKESESEDMGKKKRISMKTNHLQIALINAKTIKEVMACGPIDRRANRPATARARNQ
jgi:hypothetical protein